MRWLVLLLLIGCEDPGAATYQACTEFVDAGHCGSVDLSGTYNCGSFASSSCDLSPYFQCLTPHYKCVNGQLDPMAMMGISACTDLATCH